MQYQVARMMYQYRKLPSLRTCFTAEFGGNVEFELFAFFEICYHLKDWIAQDDLYQASHDVDGFIVTSDALRICADICNRLKHRKLTRRTRSEGLGHFQLEQSITVFPNTAPIASVSEAWIETERGKEDAFALAAECVDEWRRYFEENASLGEAVPLR